MARVSQSQLTRSLLDEAGDGRGNGTAAPVLARRTIGA
jgi:hypothetical protein